MHGCINLKLAVEAMLGWIDGDAPADFAVEVKPYEFLVFWRDADHAVGNAHRDDGGLAGRNFDLFELGEIKRVAAELNPRFLAAQRAMKGELLVLHIVRADLRLPRASANRLGQAARRRSDRE